jgi:hypothetical protein
MSWKMALIGGLAALGLSATALPLTSTSAEAQVSYGHYPSGIAGRGYYGQPAFRGAAVGGYRGGYRGGYYGGGYRGGYRGAYYGPGRYGYRRGWRGDAGGAVAAGLIGGLALGAIASAPYYGAPAPADGYSPAYYGGAHYGRAYRDCHLERRVRYNRFGERIVRRVRVCY